MKEELREELINAGVRVDEAVKSFEDDENIFMLFVKKFFQNTDYNDLVEYMDNRDYDEAFVCVHALRGTARALMLDSIADPMSKLIDNLNDDDYALAQSSFSEAQSAYSNLKTILRRNDSLK